MSRYMIWSTALLAGLLASWGPPAPTAAFVAPPTAPELRKGERPVDLTSLQAEFAALPPVERMEQARDALLFAAYASLKPSPEYARLVLGARPLLRRAYLTHLVKFDVGPGRIAPLGPGRYLVLLPAPASPRKGGGAFDWVLACRLLDERLCADGQVPREVHIALYRTALGGRATTASLRFLEPIKGKEFYTIGAYGYFEAKIAGERDLKNFLEKTDDLLLAQTGKAKGLTLAGRKYPSSTYRRPYHRLDLTDLQVLRRAVGKVPVGWLFGQNHSELGFSLDPWLESKPLKDGIKSYLDECKRRKVPWEKDLEERAEHVLKKLDEKDAFPIDRRDETGLFSLIEALQGKARAGKGLAGLWASNHARQLEGLATLHKFSAARYDGGIDGTDVGMTLFYCDVLGKFFNFGQLAGPFFPVPIQGIPQVDGFVPMSRIPIASFHREDLLKSRFARLWWGTELRGFRYEEAKADGTLRLAPVGVKIFMKARQAELAAEQEPDIAFRTFIDSWNRRYLAVADQEPELHRLNAIQKYALLLKWLKEFNDPSVVGFLDGKAPPAKVRFPAWYKQALTAKPPRVGVAVRFDFKSLTAVKTEAMQNFRSGTYYQAGLPQGWIGGVSGPSRRELEQRRSPNRPPPGLPADIVLGGGVPRGLASDYSFRWLDQRKLIAHKGGSRLTIESAPAAVPRGPEYAGEQRGQSLEPKVTIQPGKLTAEASLSGPAGAQPLGRLTIEHSLPGGALKVNWQPDARDRAYSVVQRTAAGEDVAPLVSAVKYSPDGQRAFFRIDAEKDVWVMVEAGRGSRPPPPPPTDNFLLASPDDPRWYQGRTYSGAQLAKATGLVAGTLTEPRYVSFRRTFGAEGSRTQERGEWILRERPARTWAFAQEGGSEMHYLGTTGEVVVRGKLAGALHGISPSELFRLSLFLREPSDPARYSLELQLRVGDRSLYFTRRDGKVTYSPTPEGLLKEVGEGPNQTVRAIRQSSPKGERVLRLAGDTLLMEGDWSRAADQGQVKDVLRLLRPDRELARLAGQIRAQNLTPKLLEELRARQNALNNAIAIEPVFAADDTFVGLKLPGGQVLSAKEAAKAINDNQPLPRAWTDALQNRSSLVATKATTPAQSARLVQFLQRVQPKLGQASFHLDEGVQRPLGPDGRARLRGLLQGGRMQVRADPTRLPGLSPPTLETIQKWLRSLPGDYRGQRTFRVIFDHFDQPGKTMEALVAEANRGSFFGTHVIVCVCEHELAPASRDAFRKFTRLALEKGAESVTTSGRVLDPITTTLVVDRLSRQPKLREGASPRTAIRDSAQEVLRDLQWCAEDGKKTYGTIEAAIRERFKSTGPDRVIQLFRGADGTFNETIFKRALEKLANDAGGWMEHVRRPTSPGRAPVCRSFPSRLSVRAA